MLHGFALKVRKFRLLTLKRISTELKNYLGGAIIPLPFCHISCKVKSISILAKVVSFRKKLKHLFKLLLMLLVYCYSTNSLRSDYFLTLIGLNVKENVTTTDNSALCLRTWIYKNYQSQMININLVNY